MMRMMKKKIPPVTWLLHLHLHPQQSYPQVAPPQAPVPAPSTPSSFKLAPFKKAIKRPSFTSRASSTSTTTTTDTSSTTPASGTTTPTPDKKKRPKFKRGRREKSSEYNFDTSNDMLGIVLLEIVGAENLPKLKNRSYSSQAHTADYLCHFQ